VHLAEGAGAPDIVAEAMNVELGVYHLRGDYDAADALARAALNVARSPRVRGILLGNRGAIAAQRGDFAAATALSRDSMDAFEQAGYELGKAMALNNEAAAARDAGDPDRSLALAEAAAEAARQLGAYEVLTVAMQNQAYALVALGRPNEAEAPLGEVLGHYSATDNVVRQAECLEVMGLLYLQKPDQRDMAERCFDLAQRLAEEAGSVVFSARVAGRLAELRAGGQDDATTDVERPLP
jgi:tetratricopeptide (TPR) repeat protein